MNESPNSARGENLRGDPLWSLWLNAIVLNNECVKQTNSAKKRRPGDRDNVTFEKNTMEGALFHDRLSSLVHTSTKYWASTIRLCRSANYYFFGEDKVEKSNCSSPLSNIPSLCLRGFKCYFQWLLGYQQQWTGIFTPLLLSDNITNNNSNCDLIQSSHWRRKRRTDWLLLYFYFYIY